MRWSNIVLLKMSGSENRSLIKLPGSELVISDPAEGKILTRMVNESLAIARTALADAEVFLQEGKNRLWGEGIPRNYSEISQNHSEAFALFSKAAVAGNPEAHFWVGVCYKNGYGIGEDDAQAVEWYQKSADLGSADGTFALGELYRRGSKPLPQDSSRAFALIQKAAEQGLPEAQYRLGCWYQGCGEVDAMDWVPEVRRYADAAGADQGGGEVTAMDWVEAAKWFRKAAEQGWGDAQEELGLCCFHGRGVVQDYGEAVKWFRASAVPGSPANLVLAHCLVRGLGTARDYTEAARLSANTGRIASSLGYQFTSGEWPFPRDYSLAYMWLRVAIIVKDTKGKEGLKSLIPKMSSSDLWVGETLFCEVIKQQHRGVAGEVVHINHLPEEALLKAISGGRPEEIAVSMPSEEDTPRLRRFLLDSLLKS